MLLPILIVKLRRPGVDDLSETRVVVVTGKGMALVMGWDKGWDNDCVDDDNDDEDGEDEGENSVGDDDDVGLGRVGRDVVMVAAIGVPLPLVLTLGV